MSEKADSPLLGPSTANVAQPPAKRRKVANGKDERPKRPVNIRPAPSPVVPFYAKASPLPPTPEGPLISTVGLIPKPASRRTPSMNLRNHPVSPHPVGLAIWLLQKIDQLRKDRVGASNHLGSDVIQWQHPYSQLSPPTNHNLGQNSLYSSPHGAQQRPPQSMEDNQAINTEPEAIRLQSQRERKIKQRTENWAKNKENDVVARAKLEAKKKFEAKTSETERQEWIEHRIKEDWERLLTRLAGQLRDELSYLEPFKLGFADRYFKPSNWPPGYDVDTLAAGKILAEVLPSLTESDVTEQSQRAAEALIDALDDTDSMSSAITEAVRLLSENTEVLAGIDKVLAHLFAPKTGTALARKRKDDQSRNSNKPANPLTPDSSNPLQMWYWKEPATAQSPINSRLPSAPQTSSIPYPAQFPASPYMAVGQVQPYAPAPAYPPYPRYSPNVAYPSYSWPTTYYPTYGGPTEYYSNPLSQQYPVVHRRGAEYSPTMVSQPPSYTPVSAPASCSSDSMKRPASRDKTLDIAQTQLTEEEREEGRVRRMSISPVITENNVTMSIPPGTSSQQSGRSADAPEKNPAPRSQALDGANDSRSTNPEDPLKDMEPKARRPRLAPTTPKAHRDKGSTVLRKICSRSCNHDFDGDTIEVNIGNISKDISPPPPANKTQQAARQSTRDRKPTVRALSANLTPWLLSARPTRPRGAVREPVKYAGTSPVVDSQEPAKGNIEGDDQASQGTSQDDGSSMDTNEPAASASLESGDPAPLRSSHRERKPTAKALAFANTKASKKRPTSPADSPPPPTRVLTSKSEPTELTAPLDNFESSDQLTIPAPELIVEGSKEKALASSTSRLTTRQSPPDEKLITSSTKQQHPVVRKITLRMTAASQGKGAHPARVSMKTKRKAASNDHHGTKLRRLEASEPKRQLLDTHITRPVWTPSRKRQALQQTSSLLLAYAAMAEDSSDSDSDSDDRNSIKSELKFQKSMTEKLKKFPNLRKTQDQHSDTAVTSSEKANSGDAEAPGEALITESQKSSKVQVNNVLEAPDSQTTPKTSARLSNDLLGPVCDDLLKLCSPMASASKTSEPADSKTTRNDTLPNSSCSYSSHSQRSEERVLHPKKNGLRIAKIDTINTIPKSPKNFASMLLNGTRMRINPAGLNGERPGGGTIINVNESPEAQKPQRKTRAVSEWSAESSGHGGPAVLKAKYNKGGSLMRFTQFVPS